MNQDKIVAIYVMVDDTLNALGYTSDVRDDQYIVRLIGQVVQVSVETAKIAKDLG